MGLEWDWAGRAAGGIGQLTRVEGTLMGRDFLARANRSQAMLSWHDAGVGGGEVRVESDERLCRGSV